MEDETRTFSKETPDSQLFNVSVRAWLVIVLTATICAMSIIGKEVQEPLYGIGYLAIGYYFGQKTVKKV